MCDHWRGGNDVDTPDRMAIGAGAGSEAEGKRQAQAARRREQLLKAALALFSERGYRGTSVRAITRAAGVTEAVLYHYFANKADLWAAVLAEYSPFGQIGQVLDAAGSLPLDAALRTLGLELLRLLREREQLVLTLLSEAPVEQDVATVLQRFLRGVAMVLTIFLGGRQEWGEIDRDVDVSAAATAFQGALLVHFLTTSLGAPAEPAADEATVDRLVSLLLAGLAPRSGA
jgi:AcrR family transcriptional regulator